MSRMPVMMQLAGRSVLIVGGGTVALRRAGALRAAGADVTVVARRVDPAIEALDCRVERRDFRPQDVEGRFIVVTATDDPDLNTAIADQARAAGALVNRADLPEQGDLVIPAHRRLGPITVAVSTDGISAAAAAAIRDQMLRALDEHWPELLETVRPYRRLIQQRITDPARRSALLRQLTDPQTLALFKQSGAQAVREYCEQLIAQADSP